MYVDQDQLAKAIRVGLNPSQIDSPAPNAIKSACQFNSDEYSLSRLNALIDLYQYHYLIKKGDKFNTHELFKIVSQ